VGVLSCLEEDSNLVGAVKRFCVRYEPGVTAGFALIKMAGFTGFTGLVGTVALAAALAASKAAFAAAF
jgi:hypothetical protein